MNEEQATQDDAPIPQGEGEGAAPVRRNESLDEKRARLLRSVNSSHLTTMEERVAWLLNNFPKTRDSDLNLQIRYWQHFQSDQFRGENISVRSYFRLARLTSLTRARATIQNKLKLFQANEEIRKRRGKLEEGERANAVKARPNLRKFTVYLDESGKTGDHIVVGSLWYLDASESLKIYSLVEAWKARHKLDGEIHFKALSDARLQAYSELADVIANNSAMLSFKAISVPRAGIASVQTALIQLSSHLLLRGVEHEHATGRARLPRGLSVCKDAEQEGFDRLFGAEVSQRLKQASAINLGGDLHVDDFDADNSATNVHLQLADLFTSSIGRLRNSSGDKQHAKDKFADYFLSRIGYQSAVSGMTVGDMAVDLKL